MAVVKKIHPERHNQRIPLNPATCECGQPIFWTVTQRGRRAPVDRTRTAIIDERTGQLRWGYQVHFASCPTFHAEQKRRLIEKARAENKES